MMIWYEVHLTTGHIDKVEVKRYTSKSVWVKRGYKFFRQERRTSNYDEFHLTFIDAKKAAEKHIQARLDAAQKNLDSAQKAMTRLDRVQIDNLPEPPKYDTPLLFTSEMILADIEIDVKRKAAE